MFPQTVNIICPLRFFPKVMISENDHDVQMLLEKREILNIEEDNSFVNFHETYQLSPKTSLVMVFKTFFLNDDFY